MRSDRIDGSRAILTQQRKRLDGIGAARHHARHSEDRPMTLSAYSEIPPPGFQRRRIETPAGMMALWERDAGGPALVLLHGNTASKCAFRSLLAEPALAPFRLIALDLIGAGESGRANAPERDYTMPGMARTLMAALEELNCEDAAVLGLSLGGHIAIEAAGQGAKFRAMILTGTPPCGPGAEEILSVFTPSDLTAVVTGEAPPPELVWQYVHALYGSSKAIPEEFFAAADRFDGRMRRIFSEHFLMSDEVKPQRRVVAEWPKPIAVIEGEEEPFFDARSLDALAWKNLWRGKVQMIAGSGHAPFFEQRARYAALLAEFLNGL